MCFSTQKAQNEPTLKRDAKKGNITQNRLHRNLLPRKVGRGKFILLCISASETT